MIFMKNNRYNLSAQVAYIFDSDDVFAFLQGPYSLGFDSSVIPDKTRVLPGSSVYLPFDDPDRLRKNLYVNHQPLGVSLYTLVAILSESFLYVFVPDFILIALSSELSRFKRTFDDHAISYYTNAYVSDEPQTPRSIRVRDVDTNKEGYLAYDPVYPPTAVMKGQSRLKVHVLTDDVSHVFGKFDDALVFFEETGLKRIAPIVTEANNIDWCEQVARQQETFSVCAPGVGCLKELKEYADHYALTQKHINWKSL